MLCFYGKQQNPQTVYLKAVYGHFSFLACQAEDIILSYYFHILQLLFIPSFIPYKQFLRKIFFDKEGFAEMM